MRYNRASAPWQPLEQGQFNLPTAYIQPAEDRLNVYLKREEGRIKSYGDMLVKIGMSQADADAFLARMSHVPMPNPGPERAEFIADDWIKRHTYWRALFADFDKETSPTIETHPDHPMYKNQANFVKYTGGWYPEQHREAAKQLNMFLNKSNNDQERSDIVRKIGYHMRILAREIKRSMEPYIMDSNPEIRKKQLEQRKKEEEAKLGTRPPKDKEGTIKVTTPEYKRADPNVWNDDPEVKKLDAAKRAHEAQLRTQEEHQTPIMAQVPPKKKGKSMLGRLIDSVVNKAQEPAGNREEVLVKRLIQKGMKPEDALAQVSRIGRKHSVAELVHYKRAIEELQS